ncbi:MAG: hypothetical protein K6C97_09735 [Treponema sp.]|nr:hypothetical protein [Treponema sp.]
MTYILYNLLANNNSGESASEEVKGILSGKEFTVKDITREGNLAQYIKPLAEGDSLVIVGGDGTLNRVINNLYGKIKWDNVYYYAAGSGNDFAHDVKDCEKFLAFLIPLKKYVENLPTVYVNGMQRKFINGIGFGIDGYCCEMGDEQRAISTDKINYTAIAIKGLLGKFKPCNGRIIVDGVEKKYKKIWLAPTMIGKFYGGGMMVTPDQDRLNTEHTVSAVVWQGGGKLGTLMKFPKIFEGTHLKYKKNIHSFVGHEIVVEFDKPQALQIDGETVKNVTSYTVRYN